MKRIRRSTQFEEDYKMVKSAEKNLIGLKQIIEKLIHGEILGPSYRDHSLGLI